MGRFPECPLAKAYTAPLQPGPGFEVGASSHNSFNISHTINVDFTDDYNTVFKKAEVELCGEYAKVDVVAYGDRLPFEDSSYSWCLHSHVVEHIASPIRAYVEWWRVLKNGGIIFGHIPHRDAHPGDIGRELTTLEHLVADYENGIDESTHPIIDGCECVGGHYHTWDVPSHLAMINWIIRNTHADFDVIDVRERDFKVGNSHVFVLRVVK